MNRLLDWLFDHPVACWAIPAGAFFLTGGVIWCCGEKVLGFLCAIFGAIAAAMALDAYEDAEP